MLTDDPQVFQGCLEPGDVLTFDVTSFKGGLIQWADNVPVSHVSIVLDATNLVEGNQGPRPDRGLGAPGHPGQAVRTESLATRFALPSVRTVTAFRHATVLDGTANSSAVLDGARAYLARGGDFVTLELLALGPLALRRSYPPSVRSELGGVVTFMVDWMAAAARAVIKDNSWSLSCSEFVYRCYSEAGLAIPIFAPLVDDPDVDGQVWAELVEHNAAARPGDKYRSLDDGPQADRVTPGDLYRADVLVPVAVLHKARPPSPADGDGHFA